MTAILDADGRLVRAERFSVAGEIRDGDLVALVRAKLGLPQGVF